MSTNPYQSPTEPVPAPVENEIARRADGLREYLLSGRTPGGRKVTERVEAANADAAVEALRQRGYSEIVLHTDDVSAVFTQQRRVEPHVTPKDYVGFRYRKGYLGRVVYLARKVYVQNWKWNVAFLAVLVVRRMVHSPWGVMDYAAIGVFLLPAVIALVTQISNPALWYENFMELVAWGRWAEVIEEAIRLRGRLPQRELDWQHAKALAASGKPSEGLAIVSPQASDPDLPAWLYLSRLAEVYAVARRKQEHLDSLEKALALAPENATMLLDVALALLRYQQDVGRAKRLIAQARSHALSDVLCPVADAADGMAALEDGKADQAQLKLESAIDGLNRFRNASPLIGVLQDSFRAYLALALASLGEQAAAERQFRLAEPRLRALQRDDLLDRCQRGLSVFAGFA